MNRAVVCCIFGFACGTLLPRPTFAERITTGVRDVATIQNAQGEARVLLRLDLPALDENTLIRRAILRFEIPASTDVNNLPLRIHPVTASWNPGSVDWSLGWSRPGGDFADDLFARAELQIGRSPGVGLIDFTALLKEILEDGFAADGLLVTLDPNFGEGIHAADLALFESLSSAQLEVSSRKGPRSPRAVEEDAAGGLE